jgi:uncharacterized membrane protein
MKLGVVPLAFPLLFFVAVAGARDAVGRHLPRASHLQVALLTALAVLLTDVNLEPLAWKTRAGGSGIPPPSATGASAARDYVTWCLLAFVCAFFMRSTRVNPLQNKPDGRLGWLFAC